LLEELWGEVLPGDVVESELLEEFPVLPLLRSEPVLEPVLLPPGL